MKLPRVKPTPVVLQVMGDGFVGAACRLSPGLPLPMAAEAAGEAEAEPPFEEALAEPSAPRPFTTLAWL